MKQDVTTFDMYSIAHFFSGYFAQQRGYTINQILVGAVIYELIEDPLIDLLQIKRWRKETKNNALMDILLAYAGAKVAKNR